MAACTAALHLFKGGDHVIAGHDIYGGTFRLMRDVLPGLGIEVSFVNLGLLAMAHWLSAPEVGSRSLRDGGGGTPPSQRHTDGGG